MIKIFSMRNFINFWMILFALVGIGLMVSCDKEAELSPSDIPAEIVAYLEMHFPHYAIIRAVEDVDGRSKSYEITLEGGFKLEFNRKMEIIEIEGKSKLPDSVIPVKILEYVKEHYPDQYIIEWELEGPNQKVELDNKLELIFTMEGQFLRRD